MLVDGNENTRRLNVTALTDAGSQVMEHGMAQQT
jgi:hypothetical protein